VIKPLEADDVVYLTPRTLGAPGITYQQPRCVIVRIDAHYATVRLDDGAEHTVHLNNVRRTQPQPPKPRQASKPTKPLDLPAGMEEVPLW
jgi:hypothetical protein